VLGLRKNLRKAMAAVLSTALLLPAWSGIALAGEPKPAEANSGKAAAVQVHNYQDTAAHWSHAAVETWSNYGVIQGYEDGSFKPDQEVTRGEFAAMLQNISRYVEPGNNTFSDVTSGDWFYEAVTKLQAAGIMEGSGGKANPRESVTRQEAAVLLARAFELNQTGNSAAFTDKAELAPWATAAVGELAKRSVLKGFPDGSFKPQATLTRAEATALFNQLLAQLYSKPGTYTGDINGSVLVNTADVTLKGMTISGDLYIAQGVGEGEIHLDGVTISGKVYVQGGGEHSILFNNVNVKGALVVNKYNGKVRVVASGNTNVSVAVLETGAMLVTRELSGGGFESVTIAADVLAGQQIVLDGTFSKVINKSAAASITANGTIKELVADAPTKLKGEVKVEKVSGKEGPAVTVNDKPQTTAPASGGGAPGGGGGSNGGSGSTTVAVTGVSLSEKQVTLQIGETKALSAVVAPSNATNKNVTWSVYGGSSDTITVSNNGLVTAITPGVKEVVAKTQDGGFEARVIVIVEQQANVQQGIGAVVKLYTKEWQSGVLDIDTNLINNVNKVSISQTTPSILQDNLSTVVISANEALHDTTVGKAVYAVVFLEDSAHSPLMNSEGVTVSVNGATYAPDYGTGLNAFKNGSFLFLVNAGSPEQVTDYLFDISREGHGHATLKLTYVPAGIPLLTGMEPLTSSRPLPGEKLIAPKPIFKNGNSSTVTSISYQWYRSKSVATGYQPIKGANSETYVLQEEDVDYSVRVAAFINGPTAGIPAFSPTSVYVTKPVSAEAIFNAVDARYLQNNTSADSIKSDLFLPAALPDFPGVTLSWSSSNAQALGENGRISRGNEDQNVTLTLTLGGLTSGSHTYNLVIKKIDVSTSDYIDPAFVDGYPQAYIKNGTVWVKFALNKPAEVYMLVNTSNGFFKSSVKSILEGHAGLDNQVIYTDDWPYLMINEDQVNQVQEFDTGKGISNYSREARVEFAIKDRNGNVSPSATTILFDQGTMQALDTAAPYVGNIYINNASDKVFIYYNEFLDVTNVPSLSDYQLSSGQITDVQVHNFGQAYYYPSCVILSVSGIEESQKDNLSLTYKGIAVRDTSEAKNQAGFIVNQKVDLVNSKLTEGLLSSDRKQLNFKIEPGWNMGENKAALSYETLSNRFKAVIEGKGEYAPTSVRGPSATNGYISYTLVFDSPLPEGAVAVHMDSSGLIDWARDSYPQELSIKVLEIASPGNPAAAFAQSSGKLVLTFGPGYIFNTSTFNAAGLVMKVDGEEYDLRGYIVTPNWTSQGKMGNEIAINLRDKWSNQFLEAIASGTEIELKYKKQNGNASGQLEDAADTLLPDFKYVIVKKQ
jgi:hypothetical protein